MVIHLPSPLSLVLVALRLLGSSHRTVPKGALVAVGVVIAKVFWMRFIALFVTSEFARMQGSVRGERINVPCDADVYGDTTLVEQQAEKSHLDEFSNITSRSINSRTTVVLSR